MNQGLNLNHMKSFTDLVTMANDVQLYEMTKYCLEELKERRDNRGLELVMNNDAN